MTLRRLDAIVVLGLLLVATPVRAQGTHPRAEVTTVAPATAVRPGADARLRLRVRLPAGIHIQANKPRDPSLIPTVLVVERPKGLRIRSVRYPRPADFKLQGRSEALAVFSGEFWIDVDVAVDADVAAGALDVAGTLKYQACDAISCFPPVKAPVRWHLTVATANGAAGPGSR